ncbi:MAG: hypothetical protein KatS3mg002_0964 [Candidatus Woesearchaeota archaeon]|nr:MAG: hypothetical protein KatS3mg002_0964 [Candidatus Woesearchaeota archaeon]
MVKFNHYKKVFAWISIYLILSLTFFSAKVLALDYRVSGENMVNGWRKADDITIFYVNASANVSIQLTNGQWKPMICNPQSNNYYICEYFFDRETIPSTISNITTKLREEKETPVEYTTNIKIDRISPKIEKINITKEKNLLKVEYIVKDYYHQGNNLCSGIDYITYILGSESNTIEFNSTICQYGSTIIFNESEFYQEDFPITITAYDKLGQSVTNTTKILFDSKSPEIQDDWQIMRDDQIIETISTRQASDVNYDIIVYINDPKLDVNKVHGDLSSLNNNVAIKNTLRNRKASCIKQSDELYQCTFIRVPIKVNNNTLKINVTAYDTSNNLASKTLEKSLNILNDAGQVKYVGPLKEHCTRNLDKCYASPGSVPFIAEINQGSNFSVIILGFNNEKKVAPCFFKNESWECIYRFNVPNNNQVKVYVSPESTDVYGNKLSYYEKTVHIDSIAPKILTNITSSIPSCAVASDTMELTFKVKEDTSSELKTYVNTSGIASNDIFYGDCEKNNDWECKITINGFLTDQIISKRKIVVEDLAGNKDEKEFTFEVCAENPNTVPNYISKITADNNIKIDRRTASSLPVKKYIPLTITKKDNARIMSMNVDSCYAKDDEGEDINVLDTGHYVINNNILVLYVGFEDAKLPEREFTVNCTLSSRIRSGNIAFTNPEQENVIITFSPYNNPIGQLDKLVNEKIQREKAAIRELDKEIKLRKDISNVFEVLCTLAQIIVKINNVLQLIKSTIYAVCVLLAASGIVAGPAESIWKSVGTLLNSIDVTVQTYVWPTNILSGSTYGAVIKSTCLIYTCQHYKVSGLINIGDSIVKLIDSATTEKEKTKIDEKEAKKLEESNSEMEKFFKERRTNDGVVLSDSDIQEFEKILKNNRDNRQYKFIWFEDVRSDITDSRWISGTPSDRIKYYSGEKLFIIDKDKGLMPYKFSPYYTGNIIADITGNPFLGSGNGVGGYGSGTTGNGESTSGILGSGVGWGDINNANQKYYERNLKFYSALEAEDWIINPYRSSHWDDLCAPAVVYNLQKERQIRCKYVKCMETQLVAGMPSYICDRDYGMESCLYIDSAQWHVTGGHFFENILPGLLKSFFSFLLGIAPYIGYNYYCSDYLGLMLAVRADSPAGTSLATGSKDVTCGILGTALQWREITALFSGDFWSDFIGNDIPKDPAEIHDYCADVDYNE